MNNGTLASDRASDVSSHGEGNSSGESDFALQRDRLLALDAGFSGDLAPVIDVDLVGDSTCGGDLTLEADADF